MKLKTVLVFLAIGFQAACSGSDGKKQAESEAAASKPKVEVYVDNGPKPQYWAMSNVSYPPFSFRNKDGFLTGLDIDLLNAIAEKERIEIKIMPQEMDSLFRRLDEDATDIILGGINITPARQQKYIFTQPYLNLFSAALVDEKVSGKLTSFSQLNGKPAGVVASSAYDMLAKQAQFGAVKYFPNIYQGITAMASGKVAAVYDNERVLDLYAANNPHLYILKNTSSKVYFGFVLSKKNDVLKQRLDKGLEAIRKDGTYDKILAKWGKEQVRGKI
ncbi:transporter substrate-binding domain-containing protein [Kingella negevensis]|uniref:substrate-binding periplasmic protein n=1 Tax=Kingella negevensis TaxID=1522312 RepID=UPI00254ACDC4|nr:transporter substrate-binding domain-containing protein [Kingella negevensis]MDK4683710.1 transporter substrate-binding domain-containing protein [Kingella negevensis]MDK4708394.1 transporter substrate-binding domain-containing protein [Kingella negevensis]MDK4710944.1 transporter substrate-binding domain-containing protein [Kingella negevensis]